MKKNIFNSFGILILLCAFFTSKADRLPGHDSLPAAPVNSLLHLVNRSPLYFTSPLKKEDNRKDLNRFIFSAVVTPRFETTIPPVNLYFEHGIAGLASAGISFGVLYDSESSIDYHAATISVGIRGCGYVLPIISKASGNEIKQYGFQPYAGLVFDYFTTAVSIDGDDPGAITSSKFGVCVGTRWYPGKGKFGLLGEFNSNGIGNNIRFGVSLGR